MVEWWSSIPSFEKLFWIVAVPSSTIFVLQTIMTLLGLSHGAEANLEIIDDMPHDHSLEFTHESSSEVFDVKFKLFTMRSIVVFFTVFSWTGIASVRGGRSHLTSIIFAVILGFILMFVVSFIYYSAIKLSEEGTMDIKNAVNAQGEVYLTLPKEGKGIGKIQVVIQGVLRTMDAVTYGEELQTGTKITVIRVIDNQLLLVEKID